MKAKTLQITWHAKEGQKNDPIFSIDFHPELPLLATSGQDSEIKIWRLNEPGAEYRPVGGRAALSSSSAGEPSVEYLFTLLGHDSSVNGVRWSPNGECLASVSDDSTVIVWTPKAGFTWDQVSHKNLIDRHFLRGHAKDVYDVCWAPDSRRLVTGSVDNKAIVWDITKGRGIAVLDGHTQFVQGVSWDPTGAFIVTQSTDRTARVYRAEPEVPKAGVKRGRGRPALNSATTAPGMYKCVQVIKAREIEGEAAEGTCKAAASAGSSEGATDGAGAGAGASSSAPAPAKHHMFMDENSATSFFRRPAFTPDGSLLLTPAGQIRDRVDAPSKATTWVFPREALQPAPGAKNTTAKPLAHLPVCTGAMSKPASVVVRCSPVLYSLRDTIKRGTGEAVTDNAAFKLPYRMMWAVGTLDSVLVYDSQHPYPLAVVANMHYDKLTDLAWSPSGRVLLLSSIDGYCSMVVFDHDDVGERLPTEALPPALKTPCKSQPSFPAPKPKKAKGAEGAAADGAEAGAEGAHEQAQPATPDKAEEGAGAGAGSSAAAGAGASSSAVGAEAGAKPAKRKIAVTLLSAPGDAVVPVAGFGFGSAPGAPAFMPIASAAPVSAASVPASAIVAAASQPAVPSPVQQAEPSAPAPTGAPAVKLAPVAMPNNPFGASSALGNLMDDW